MQCNWFQKVVNSYEMKNSNYYKNLPEFCVCFFSVYYRNASPTNIILMFPQYFFSLLWKNIHQQELDLT